MHEVVQSMDEDFKTSSVTTNDTDDAKNEAIAYQLSEWLIILKYNHLLTNDEDYQIWHQRLERGDKDVIYQILFWALSSFDKLCKRAYLSKYLIPLEPPPEIMIQGDPILMNLLDEYKQLQEDFKGYHKEYERIKASTLSKGRDVKAEMSQLKNERTQLKIEIDKIQLVKHEYENFDVMHDLTREVRKLEDELFRLEDQKRNQVRVSDRFDQECRSLQRRIRNLQGLSQAGTLSAQEILDLIKKDNDYMKTTIYKSLEAEKELVEEETISLEFLCQEPHRSTREIEELNGGVLRALNQEISDAKSKIATSSGDSLASYRQVRCQIAAHTLFVS